MRAAIFPDRLAPATWAKPGKLAPLPDGLLAELKALEQGHAKVDWRALDPTVWTRRCTKAEELGEAFAKVDRLYRSEVFPLKKCANAVGTALKPDTEKSRAKSIRDAIDNFVDAIDDGAVELKAAFDAAAKALAGAAADDDDEPPSVLLDPARLLSVLQRCKRNAGQQVAFAFVDGKDKQAPVLAMHPKTGERRLIVQLLKATGAKAGSFGRAWVDDTTLYLQVTGKVAAGLVKKVRIPLKAAGFRVTKVVLWDEEGLELEKDDEDPEGQQSKSLSEFTARFEKLAASIRGLAGTTAAAEARLLASQAAMASRKSEWEAVDALMEQAETLLESATGKGGAEPPVQELDVATSSSESVYVLCAEVWKRTRDQVGTNLRQLEEAILEVYKGQPVIAEVERSLRGLDAVMNTFNAELADRILAVKSAPEGKRARLRAEAYDRVKTYQTLLNNDRLVLRLDRNPFLPINVEATLRKSLDLLEARLSPRAT